MPSGPDVFRVDDTPLSSDELTELAKKVVTVFPEDATLVMVVDADWSVYQISVLESMFANMGKRKVAVIPEPRKMAMVKVGPARTREERIDFLARIGIIWEDNPGLTLAEIIKTMAMLPSSPGLPEDEVIVSALELAWG